MGFRIHFRPEPLCGLFYLDRFCLFPANPVMGLAPRREGDGVTDRRKSHFLLGMTVEYLQVF